MKLVFIDTETTGLDPTIHEAYEVAWAVEEGPVCRMTLPHSLANSSDEALAIGRYRERGFEPTDAYGPMEMLGGGGAAYSLFTALTGATLVGSNPAFDAAFLRKVLGEAPWNHRMIDVAQAPVWLPMGPREPMGLASLIAWVRDKGFLVHDADHTAHGDVLATRDVFTALQKLRLGWRP